MSLIIRSRLRFLLPVILGALLCQSNSWAQYSSNVPGWVANTWPADRKFVPSHPGLVTVDKRWSEIVLNSESTVEQELFSDYIVGFHPLHGDLAIHRVTSATFNVGGFDTGLDYIYSVTISRDGLAPTGIVVSGQVGDVSQVLYSDWPLDGDPATWSFSPLIPNGPTGSRYLVAQVIGQELYVFDAASETVLRYVDGDLDGLPDGLQAPATLDVNLSGAIGPVFGFHRRDGGKVGVSFHPPGDLSWALDDWEIVDTSQPGVLSIERRTPVLAGKCGFLEDHLVAGQGHVRVYGGYLSSVYILSGPSPTQLQRISGSYKILDPSGNVSIKVSPPLAKGDVVKIVSSGITGSDFAPVVSMERFMLPQEAIDDTPIDDGGGIILKGVNLDNEVSVEVDIEGAAIPVKTSVLGPEILLLSSLAIPDGGADEEVMHIVVNHREFRHSYEYWIGILK